MNVAHFSVKRGKVLCGRSSANDIMMPKQKATAFKANWWVRHEGEQCDCGCGLDTCVFQVYWVEMNTGEEKSVQLSRANFLSTSPIMCPTW